MNDERPAFVLPPPRVEPTPRWIRTELGGETIGDSKQAILHVAFGPPLVADSPVPMLPGYFFPIADVRMELLEEAGADDQRQWWHVTAGDTGVDRAAWTYLDSAAVDMDLTEHVTFRWEAMDAWYEEAEQVFVHARDPRKRVDVRESSRTIEVRFDGETLATSDRPRLLFETDLPTRFYLPPEDVNMDRMVPSDSVTACPYKGRASYWSLADAGETGADIAWAYPDPVDDCPRIKDLVCFYNEKVDILLDGEELPRPKSPWS